MNRGPTKVYRHYDKDDELLYIGCSANVLSRTYMHENGSHWFDSVSYITIEHYKNREDALCAENSAIKNERPKYNKPNLGGYSDKTKYNANPELTMDALGKLREKGYSITEISKMCNLTSQTIKNIIKNNGKHVSINTYIRLGIAFNYGHSKVMRKYPKVNTHA